MKGIKFRNMYYARCVVCDELFTNESEGNYFLSEENVVRSLENNKWKNSKEGVLCPSCIFPKE